MLYQQLGIIAPIIICACIGFVWSKKRLPYNADFVSTLVMNIGAPCLIVSTLSKVDIPKDFAATLVLVAASGLALTALLSVLALRLARWPIREFLPALLFPNTGNMGLPLCLFAFGDIGLGMGLILFIVISLCHFSLGVTLVSQGNVWSQLIKAPVVYSALISLLLIATGWQLPLWLNNTVGLLGGMSIPLMLIALGVSLSSLAVSHVKQSVLGALFRLGIGIGVGLLLVWLFDLEGVMRGVVLIQCAMPSAVFNYLLAHRYQQNPEAVAGVVVCSTLISFLSLPFLIALAQG